MASGGPQHGGRRSKWDQPGPALNPVQLTLTSASLPVSQPPGLFTSAGSPSAGVSAFPGMGTPPRGNGGAGRLERSHGCPGRGRCSGRQNQRHAGGQGQAEALPDRNRGQGKPGKEE
ncbi:KH homology domain-containing protein 4-like isoform X1 [Huso huso]|uniref:KH homology domain-containing protein 4-like isoform X1 n=1 Tax=Huso huso TaxID=61971 RepID=A0ABR0YG41_HUSHU